MEMAAAEVKAVSNIHRFAEFAFFLDKTAVRLLARVASLNVLTLFLGRGAG
jgi:hypothetical protein